MPQRTVVQPTGLQLSNLAEPLTVEITKAETRQSIAGELGDDHGTNPDPRVVANGIVKMSTARNEMRLLRIPYGQSVPPDADKIPPSGADFNRASVDALPGGALPLLLLGQEKQATEISDVDNTASRHIAQALAPSLHNHDSIAGRSGDHGIRGRIRAAQRRAGGHACGSAIVSDHDEGRHDQFCLAGRIGIGVARRPYADHRGTDVP